MKIRYRIFMFTDIDCCLLCTNFSGNHVMVYGLSFSFSLFSDSSMFNVVVLLLRHFPVIPRHVRSPCLLLWMIGDDFLLYFTLLAHWIIFVENFIWRNLYKGGGDSVLQNIELCFHVFDSALSSEEENGTHVGGGRTSSEGTLQICDETECCVSHSWVGIYTWVKFCVDINLSIVPRSICIYLST